jgi:hypothetical protein
MSSQYGILNPMTGYFVDMEEKHGTPVAGTFLDAYPGTNTGAKSNQLWTFEQGPFVAEVAGFPALDQGAGDGSSYYFIKSVLNGLVIQFQESGKAIASGAPLCVAKQRQTNNANQLWKIFPYTSTTEVDIDAEPIATNSIYILSAVSNASEQGRGFVMDIQEKGGSPKAGTRLDGYPMRNNNNGNQLWQIVGPASATHRKIVNFPGRPTFGSFGEVQVFSVGFLGTGFAPGIGVSFRYTWADTDGNLAVGSINGPTQNPSILTADFSGNVPVIFMVYTGVNTGTLTIVLQDYDSNSVTLSTALAANGTFYNTTQS